MSTFKVPCPSCEAKVVIKNPNLIGTKVECPKCKYRFKVEAPADESAAGDAKPAKVESAADAGAKAKKKKKMIGIGLGVVAVALLGGVGYAIFGGETKKQTPSKSTIYTGGKIPTPGGDDPDIDKDKKDKPVDPGVKASLVPASDKDPTNLLHRDSVAVYRFDFDKLRLTHLGPPIFDKTMTELFEASMGPNLKAASVDKYFHCIVGEKERAPFGLICIQATLEKDIAIVGAGKAKVVNGKNLSPVVNNAFFTAIGQSFSGRSLLADAYERPFAAIASKTKETPLGVCIYDTQHIMVGDYAVLEKYLNGLKDGYPEFQTIWKKDTTAPSTPAPKTGPMGPMPPMVGAAPMTGTPMAPMPPSATPTPAGNKDYTSNPSYLSVSGDLKKMLNALEEDQAGPPAVVMAEKFNNEIYSRKGVKKSYESITKLLDPVLDRTSFIGLNVTNFSPRQFSLTIRIVGKTAEEARQIALEHLTPALNDAIPLLSLVLETNITLRNYADPNFKPMGSEFPGGPNGLPGIPLPGGPIPGGPLGPPMIGGPPGPGGLRPPMIGPMGPPASGGPMGPLPGPGSLKPPMGGFPMGPLPGPGSLKPPMGGFPMGPPMGGFPMGPPMGGFPMGPPIGPWIPGTPGQPSHPDPMQQHLLPSYIDLRLTDQVVTINVTVNWTYEAFNRFVYPQVSGFANQLKGKTTVYAGNRSWTGLSQAVVNYVKEKKQFPAGTIARPPSDPSRLGLSYPPIQRYSFFVELLPYLGRAEIRNRIELQAGWYEPPLKEEGAKENEALFRETAAQSWVPEFLVPYYDQSSWRAVSPLAPNRSFGGTNYVAIAGVGPDAARFNPKNPAQQKLIGISGYDWGSKVEEVTDGLENTIYLMQVPPGYARPWAAGGGATVVGLDRKDPMADFKHQRPDGKLGTYAIMGDGAVRWIPADIKPADLLALATRAGGEKLSDDLNKIAPRVDGVTSPELKADPKAVDPMPKATDPKSIEKSTGPKTLDPKPSVRPMPEPPAKPGVIAPAPREK